MPSNNTAAIIPFGRPDEARGQHVARRLDQQLRLAGLGGTSEAGALREAIRQRMVNPPLWDRIAGAVEVLVNWSWHYPMDQVASTEAAIDHAILWMGATLPDPTVGLPFSEDELGVLYDGQWTSYCLHTGARLEPHPTAPDWLHELL